MLWIGAATKLFFEATAGGTLRKFALKLWLLIQYPSRCPVTVTMVRSSGTGATVMNVEFELWPRPPLVYTPGPEKLVNRFCGQSSLAMLEAGSNTQDPPVQPSLASRNPTPWW